MADSTPIYSGFTMVEGNMNRAAANASAFAFKNSPFTFSEEKII